MAQTFKEKQKTVAQRQQALRKNATNAELILKIKLEALGLRVMFQKGFIEGPNYVIVDFYLPKLKLCIEVDGGYHSTKKQKARDKNKDEYIRGYRKFRLLRISNEDAETVSIAELKQLVYSAR